MDFQTPSSLTVSVSPSAPAAAPSRPPSAPSVCPFSGAAASSSSTSSCPFASSSSATSDKSPAQSELQNQSQSQTPQPQHTCPFATVIPSSRLPVQQTLPDGTVVDVPRRCPHWVRVLRFSAKFVAKQVIVRTAKKALVFILNSMRAPDAQTNTNININTPALSLAPQPDKTD